MKTTGEGTMKQPRRTKKYCLAREIAPVYGITTTEREALYQELARHCTWWRKEQRWIPNDIYLHPVYGEIPAFPMNEEGRAAAAKRGLYTWYDLRQRGKRPALERAVRAVLRHDLATTMYTDNLYDETEAIENFYQYESEYEGCSRSEYGHLRCYASWEHLPPHLKTKTQIRKTDLKRRPKQAPVAVVDTRFDTYDGYERGGVYLLYDVRDCLPKKPPTEKQRTAFEQVRQQSTCSRCGATGVKLSQEDFCPRCQARLDERREFCAMLRRARNDAIRWARELLETGFVILDTETTGLEWDAKIVEITVIDGLSGESLLNTLLDPQEPIPKDATTIHGITDEMVKGKPRFQDIMPDIEAALTGRTCVIYNVAYDTPLLKTHGLATQSYRFECAMEMYAQFHGSYSDYHESFTWQSLSNALAQCKLDWPGTAHRALGDCAATRAVIQYMAACPLQEGEA